MAGSRLTGREEYARARRRMVERLADRGIGDRRVLAAFEEVPRHRLVPEALHGQAYQDTALPIGAGQTISAPTVVAMMTEALELSGRETLLEVGTGSGYQAAILSRLVERVVSVERVPKLAAAARSSLDRLGVTNVVVYLGDGTAGRAQDGPYDGIVVTAGGPEIPPPLLEQLAPGGRLVGPFGAKDQQELLRVHAAPQGFQREVIGRCRFVDLVGAHGWVA